MREEYVGNVKICHLNTPNQEPCKDELRNDLLDIVKNFEEDEYEQIICERKSGLLLYHLSSRRQNLLEWIPFKKTDSVLEMGAECGALTGILAERAGHVDSMDFSEINCLINAYRHKNYSNLDIFAGYFSDFDSYFSAKYDYIILADVLEHAQMYCDGLNPYEDLLMLMLRHLKVNGKLIIAIENRLGLKYWAGCREDHLGTFFSGLENYQRREHVKTFTRRELEKLLQKTGVEQYEFYYPYPDHKFPTSIYSDSYLPRKGELNVNIRNFDQSRLVLFDEARVFDTILEEGMFQQFSNSFLIIAG